MPAQESATPAQSCPSSTTASNQEVSNGDATEDTVEREAGRQQALRAAYKLILAQQHRQSRR